MTPFLKWVGGKRQLLKDIRPFIPAQFDRYVEPFMGGGAVFFDLAFEFSWVNDVNSELVNCYEVVRDDVEVLIAHLSEHKYEKTYFLEQRALDRVDGGLASLSPLVRASRFIFLNRTGFNGMYRVNSKGYFNVPFGTYKNPTIVNAELLRQCSQHLQRVKITNKSFMDVLAECKKGDFVYLDPPYVPISPTANFTQYSDGAFGQGEQVQLAEELHRLNAEGIPFLASNSYTPLVLELYEGLSVTTVLAKRAINSQPDRRQAIKEVLISNK